MLKRPLHSRFGSKVLTGIKCTTIRDTPWPVGKPIMLYHWSARPYASPQINVAAVAVTASTPISIHRLEQPSGRIWQPEMNYMVDLGWWVDHIGSNPLMPPGDPDREPFLFQVEGFDSQDDMDTWFRAKLKPGRTVHKHLMRFKLLNLEPGT